MELAQISHELRLMPLPYGLLPHELIEIIDNERIIPGISYLFKLGEDFPFLNNFNFMNIDTDGNTNFHQRALLFDPGSEKQQQSQQSSLFKLIRNYKLKPTTHDTLLTYKDFHNIRYSFVVHLFNYYKQAS